MPWAAVVRTADEAGSSAAGAAVNPAGVVLDAGGLDDADMQRIAAEVDVAETAFVTGMREDGARAVRYFSPIAFSPIAFSPIVEVPFCGHATIATAVALAERSDADAIVFDTPVGDIRIEIERGAGGISAAFTSAPTSVRALDPDDRDAILLLLGLSSDELDSTLPPRIADAGNPHPVIGLSDRTRSDAFTFDPHRAPARIAIEQGLHVGRPGLLVVDVPATGRVRVSGVAVPMTDATRPRVTAAS
ncbi:PhzF family phenazine biosynthesis protein [Microbacterium hominis]|uniref:PhzF family phenazine biosynthesis protein n=1 Tax=Microbacterium hominis TaxID=162426 RepID=UPI0009DD47BF|nr:PhzF family phenazine biosynthesis isomerase [Microbacterium hominis]